MIRVLAIVALSILVGCGDGSGETTITVPLEMAFSSNQCQRAEQGVSIFSSQNVWEEWVLNQSTQLSMEDPRDISSAEIYPVDSASSIMLISMGQRSSGGFSVGILDSEATLTGNNLTLRVAWHTPAEDSFQAQIMTSPCIAFRLERLDLGKIAILNDGGEVIFEQKI